MRSLMAALLSLLIILFFCLWYSHEVACVAERLTAAARCTITPESLSSLLFHWNKEKSILSVAVNRRLVTEAEKSLALMQAHQHDKDPALFYSARTAFLQTLKTIQSSYSISFKSII